MSIEDEERSLLKRAHNSRKWVMKVNKMTDKEVKDILERLKLQKKVE